MAKRERAPSWYEDIEAPIRGLVKVLRDCGYNTTHSCGHEMYVEMYYEGDDLRHLASFLSGHGFQRFRVTFDGSKQSKADLHCAVTVWLPLKNGKFSRASYRKGTTDP